ncbi:hypothetical protein GCM10018987_33170 [Streptomyces cremeus]
MITAADIGARVVDTDGRVGILRDLIEDYVDPAAARWARRAVPTAFLQRECGGGREWLVPVGRVRRV